MIFALLNFLFDIDNQKNYTLCMDKFVEFKGVNYRYISNYCALCDINYKFYAKKHYIIYGEELSGKSTLARVFCGLESNYEGEILYDGKKLNEGDEFYKNEIVYLPIQQVFFENKTVLENIEYAYNLRNTGKCDFQKVTNNFNLSELSNVKCKNLSNFQRVMVSLARASMRKFAYLVIDECLDNLSEDEVNIVFDKIKLLDYKTLILTTVNDKLFKENDFIKLNMTAGYLKEIVD